MVIYTDSQRLIRLSEFIKSNNLILKRFEICFDTYLMQNVSTLDHVKRDV